MKFSVYISKRYFFAKKSHNAINIISAISVIVVAIVSFALIVLLSVVNGFEQLVAKLYSSFDSDLKIEVYKGKFFDPTKCNIDAIRNLSDVKYCYYVIEENALIKYREKQYIATVKGVENDFFKMSRLDTLMYKGDININKFGNAHAVVGLGIDYSLSLPINDYVNPIEIYAPKRGYKTTLSIDGDLTKKSIVATGVFSVQQDFDNKYFIVPLAFASDLFEANKEISAIEIGLKQGASMEVVQNKVQKIIGNRFQVINKYQQHEVVYKIFKVEKLAVFLIICFILMIAIFNVIGSITMLIIDKKEDVHILKSLGATNTLIRRIFLLEGMFVSIIGVISGLSLGLIVCILQLKFGLVKIGDGTSMVISVYPVKIEALDFIATFMAVIIIGYIAAWYPVRHISRKYIH